MKPIRSNELEFFKDMIREKFYDKKETLRTQITSDAQKLADKKQPLMARIGTVLMAITVAVIAGAGMRKH